MVLCIDIGSSATKAVLLDEGLRLLESWERPNRGNPGETFRDVVSEIFKGPGRRVRSLGITGAGRETVEAPPEVFLPNEVVALALGAAHAYPEVRSVIEIGARSEPTEHV